MLKNKKNGIRIQQHEPQKIWGKLALGGLAVLTMATAGLWMPLFAQHAALPQSAFLVVDDPTLYPDFKINAEMGDNGRVVLTVEAKHFQFSDICDPQAHGLIGHAHLYINDVKIATLRSPSFTLPKLSAGDHRITVSLNDKSHRFVVAHGKPMIKTEVLDVGATFDTVPALPHATHAARPTSHMLVAQQISR